MDISKISVNTQSSIRIETGKVIYLDPLELPGEAHDGDYIFVTHDHYDHLSAGDILKVLKDTTVLVVPAPAEGQMRKIAPRNTIITVVPGQRYETADFAFETVPAYNKLKPFHPRRAGWVGYILTIEGERIYIAGDTDATAEASEVKCDVALLPIGGTYTMNYKEAAKLVNTIRPKAVIPTHYGSIVGSGSDGEEFRRLVEDGIRVELQL